MSGTEAPTEGILNLKLQTISGQNIELPSETVLTLSLCSNFIIPLFVTFKILMKMGFLQPQLSQRTFCQPVGTKEIEKFRIDSSSHLNGES